MERDGGDVFDSLMPFNEGLKTKTTALDNRAVNNQAEPLDQVGGSDVSRVASKYWRSINFLEMDKMLSRKGKGVMEIVNSIAEKIGENVVPPILQEHLRSSSFAEKIGESVVNSFAEKIGESVDPLLQEHCGYVTDYGSNMKTLKAEVDRLGIVQNEAQHSVDEARNNGQVIAPGLDSLLTKADRIKEDVKKMLEEEVRLNNLTFPDLVSCYNLGKDAKTKTQHVIGLRAEIAWSNFADFESRMSIMKEIMAVLKDDNINAIGICGLGGVGKTTMVQKIRKRAKVEKLFDEIVMVVVSQNQDVKKIQKEIGRTLGLTLKEEEEDLAERADTLRARLMDDQRVLIILDDVWNQLDLEEIGIPFGGVYKGCKVMLTSRSIHVCTMTGTHSNFTIGVLSEQEAWNLFKEKAGNSIDSPDLNQIAKEVVKECGGLPIAIVTVGSALKGQDEPVWRNALGELKKANPENIEGMEKYVYQSIKLSYDFLGSEAKSFLLLCCLFEEDADIWFSQLVGYGMGLCLFRGIDALEEARNRVYALIGKLKGFYLLLAGSHKDQCVKVHDVVRDVIRFIAMQGKEVFMYGDGREVKEWLTENRDEQYPSLSLISNKVDDLPDRLDCTKLELLQLTINCFKSAPDDLFEGMKELRVLNLSRVVFRLSPPRSLSLLTKLRTLYLCDCHLKNVSAIGELKALVILSFRGSSFKELPREIGNLTHLKLLDLTKCRLERISPGVILRLKRLEELYVTNSGLQWVVEEEGKGENMVKLAELLSLSNLTHLETLLPYAKFPRGINHFKNLERFWILINDGEGGKWSPEDDFRNELELHLDTGIAIDGWLNVLLKKTETLNLTLRGAKNVLNDLITPESLVKLKSLSLCYCEGLEYLIDAVDFIPDNFFPNLESLKIDGVDNLKMICHGELPARSFRELRRLDLGNLPELMHLWKDPIEVVSLRNLRHVEVKKCHKLENLFSQSTASGLEQLEVLRIQNCNMMEEIIAMEKGEHGETITNKLRFPKLSELSLVDLPSLIGFCKKMDEIEFPQLSTLFLKNLPELCSFCPNIMASEGNHDSATQHLFNQKVKSMCELRSLTMHSCNKLLNVFSSNVVQSLRNLEELSIISCNLIEVVFDFEGINIEEGCATLALTCLKKLNFASLPKLTHLWKVVPLGIRGFQNLRSLEVEVCWSLKSIFTPSIVENLLKLEELSVSDCAIMEIVGKEQEDREENEEATKVIVFRQLKQLHLGNLPYLMSFDPKLYTFEFPILEELSLNKSNVMVFIPSILGTRKQRTINVRSNEEVHEQQIVFPSLEGLRLKGEDNMEGILNGQLLAHSFCNLRALHVKKCKELLVVPSNWLPGLQKLEELTIGDCDSLVEVFEVEGMNVEERGAVLLPMLKELRLWRLPKLECLLNEKLLFPTCLFPDLKFLYVENCGNLRNLFSHSMARALVHLKKLTIASCEMMEEIVVKGENEEANRRDKIVIPRLQHLELYSLQNLTSFCQSPYAFDLPLLEDVLIYKCPKMKAFSMGDLSTPKLWEVRVKFLAGEHFWMGDLNNTIQELFHRNRKKLVVNQEIGYEEHLDDNDDDHEN